ncbi:sulfurtransferase complex subunit TusB [Candidatus Parabeggiatoa sp. HSG14]|uniref:sulfurtransferase complex subunit TusB n=1 Tax=Candidatus Parabeggiatoa sp. HSG14 TaxID=3055593 RepID=UPI0025A82185|nr:sulfurtransferase complex subunit TusB [Thiotrichales bacterium HSG14]
MLHTVNKSPYETNSLSSCLRLARKGHTILLFENGIYGALKGTCFENVVTDALNKYQICVLMPDIEARGMRVDNVITGIKTVDYAEFVDLVASNSTVQAWL